MKTNGPVLDPEAVALAKVYALLIRAGRQRKARQTKEEGLAETAQSPDETVIEPETSGMATVPGD